MSPTFVITELNRTCLSRVDVRALAIYVRVVGEKSRQENSGVVRNVDADFVGLHDVSDLAVLPLKTKADELLQVLMSCCASCEG